MDSELYTEVRNYVLEKVKEKSNPKTIIGLLRELRLIKS
jgi:hypothetical protein